MIFSEILKLDYGIKTYLLITKYLFKKGLLYEQNYTIR